MRSYDDVRAASPVAGALQRRMPQVALTAAQSLCGVLAARSGARERAAFFLAGPLPLEAVVACLRLESRGLLGIGQVAAAVQAQADCADVLLSLREAAAQRRLEAALEAGAMDGKAYAAASEAALKRKLAAVEAALTERVVGEFADAVVAEMQRLREALVVYADGRLLGPHAPTTDDEVVRIQVPDGRIALLPHPVMDRGREADAAAAAEAETVERAQLKWKLQSALRRKRGARGH
jgi:hypothetical protein